jgi:hypothetical protein
MECENIRHQDGGQSASARSVTARDLQFFPQTRLGRSKKECNVLLSFSLRNLILILGVPRSGTTWLATIFDSNDNVLYRHEPDIVDRGSYLPSPCSRADILRYCPDARAYIQHLATLSTLKIAGHPLFFRKKYRSSVDTLLRMAQTESTRMLATLWSPAARTVIDDRLREDASVHVVIKSVSGCGRAGLYAEAVPEARILFIIRNPFGQVASMVRGMRMGKLNATTPVEGLWDWPEAASYGLTRDRFLALPLVEQIAWHWTLHTEKALAELHGREGVRIVCYEVLCARPQAEVTDLFAFTNLSVGEQTRQFVRRSTSSTGFRSYYSVLRHSAAAAERWRSELSRADQERIAAIVSQSQAYEYYKSMCQAAGIDS